jgi:hypothetical protein
MPARGEFPVTHADLITSLTLARVLPQGMKTTVQQGKVLTPPLASPLLLGITANLTKILKSLPGKREVWH